MLESLLRDLRYAVLALRRSPGFALGATLVLALGIASSVAVFSMLDTLVLRPLPLRAPDRLFAIGTQPPPDAQWTMQTVRLSVVDQWQSDSKSFEQVAGFTSPDLTWQAPEGPERVAGAAVVGDLFALLGANMTLGRAFAPTEVEDAPAILSHAFWQQRFGARPDVLGQVIELDGTAYRIVGVLPPETDIPILGADRLVWIPLSRAGLAPDRVLVRVIGRLRRGVRRDAATAELAALKRSSEQEFGENATGVVLQSIQEDRSALVGPTLVALLGGSLVLLMIACANVGTLSLARLVERRHEMAVRSSLGASRWSLLRQVVTEHVVLWSIGGIAGIALGAVGLRWVLSADPLPAAQVPPGEAIPIDARSALFAIAATLGTAVLFGLPAARQSSNARPVAVLRENGGAMSSSRTSSDWRQWLVVAQVALSTVLASAACLLALSLVNLTSQPLGFRPDNMLTFHLQLPVRDYPDQDSRLQFQRALLRQLRALPGVETAATTSAMPLGTIPVGPISVDGFDPRGERPWAGIQTIDAQYLRAAGISIVSGRGFDDSDRADGEQVLVVNETFARTYFPGGDALDKRVALTPDGSEPLQRIVGVIADVKHAGLDWEYLPEIFTVYNQIPDGPISALLATDIYTVVRVPSTLTPTEQALRRLVAGLDRGLPVMAVRTGQQIVTASAKSARFRATVMGGVAALAVLLSGMGLFAVLRQSVAQHRKEFGIRMALGATPVRLLAGVCRAGVGLAALGIGGGIIASLALARYMQSLLFGIDPIEPAVLIAVAAFMIIVAFAAAIIPAWRTTKLSPTLAIRNG